MRAPIKAFALPYRYPLPSASEERHLPVGCPDFKSGGTCKRRFGGFDSYLFRQKIPQA
jgi:hypothetical protein